MIIQTARQPLSGIVFDPPLVDVVSSRRLSAVFQIDQEIRTGTAMDATIQIRQRGSLTLPVELRERYGIEPGDTFRILDLDGIFVLTPMTPMVPELAREIERARLEAGLDTADLLQALREQRARYVAETYGDE